MICQRRNLSQSNNQSLKLT